MKNLHKINLISKLLFFYFMFAMLGACSVSEHMQVRDGITPENVDKQVRFRTTYYFRVFDSCLNRDDPDQVKIPLADTLYRFRMTGKANAATQKIRFESGTLKAQEIDPFGATIEWDEDNNRAYFVSTEMANNRTQYLETKNAIDDLIELREQLVESKSNEKFSSEINTLIKNLINKKLVTNLPPSNTVTTTTTSNTVTTIPSTDSDTEATSTTTSTSTSILNDDDKCPTGFIHNKGFQIMGPEGFRTFDQDERLILAMSASGKPLLGAMKELAGRYLKGQPAPNEAERLLPLTREELRISQANRDLDTAKVTVSVNKTKYETELAEPQPEGSDPKTITDEHNRNNKTKIEEMFTNLLNVFKEEKKDE